AKEALGLLRDRHVDCVLLDLRLPDSSGLKLLEQVRRMVGGAEIGAIVYTAAEVTPAQRAALRKLGAKVLTKGRDSTASLVEAVFQQVGPARVIAGRNGSTGGDELRGRRVLVVDDDIRNIFA